MVDLKNLMNTCFKKIVPIFYFLFLVLNIKTNAQILMSKPYLKVTNTISGNVYKLKSGKKIAYLLLHDSIYRKGIIKGFLDTNIIEISGKQININDFVYMKFKPKSKLRRNLKLMYYTSWLTLVTSIFINGNNCTDAACPDPRYLVIILTPGIVFWGEVGGGVIQLLTSQRELYKDYNLKLEIVKE
jgi:hypothetical protein